MANILHENEEYIAFLFMLNFHLHLANNIPFCKRNGKIVIFHCSPVVLIDSHIQTHWNQLF